MNLGLIYKRQQHSPGLKEQRKMQMDRRDINQNYLLDIGEAWRYVASGAVSLGQQTNLGSVSAIAVDPNGVPLGIPPVTDTDPANYLGPPSSSVKFILRGMGALRVPTPLKINLTER